MFDELLLLVKRFYVLLRGLFYGRRPRDNKPSASVIFHERAEWPGR